MVLQTRVPRSVPALLLTFVFIGMAESAAAQFREPAVISRVSTTRISLTRVSTTWNYVAPVGTARTSTAADPTRMGSHRPAPERGGAAAFAIEALGGAAGSAAGFGIGVLLADPGSCNNEDIQCILQDVAVALGASAAGAALGTWGAGSLADTRPSLPGAALGSLAGAVAGLGTLHLLTEELDLNVGDGVQFVSYVVTHGVVAALGSRLVAAIRH